MTHYAGQRCDKRVGWGIKRHDGGEVVLACHDHLALLCAVTIDVKGGSLDVWQLTEAEER